MQTEKLVYRVPWDSLRARLNLVGHKEAKQESTKYLHASDIKELAAAYDMKDEEIQSFLKFHHTLGDFIHFDDPGLDDVVITDPQWLVNVSKSLITTKDFVGKRKLSATITQELNRGMVSKQSLAVLWRGNNVEFLIQLMTKFNLIIPAYSNEESKFLIASMLPAEKRDIYETEPFKSMVMMYHAKHPPQFGDSMVTVIFVFRKTKVEIVCR